MFDVQGHIAFPVDEQKSSSEMEIEFSFKQETTMTDDQPPGKMANEVLCKSPASPFARRVHFSDRRHILSVARSRTNRSHFSFQLVNPDKANEFRNKFLRFDSSSIYFERKVYLYKQIL